LVRTTNDPIQLQSRDRSPLRGSEPKRLGVDGCYKQATPYGVYAYTRKPTLSSQAKDVGNDKR